MKTRQEMIYDFMVALSSNGRVYKEWLDWGIEPPLAESYGDHVLGLAEELADNYLKEQK